VTRLPGVMTDVLPGADDGELFRRARRLGFAGVEVVLKRSEPARIEGLRRARAETGLAVPSLVLGEHSDLGGIADAEPGVAAAAAADVERALEWAAALGADALLLPFFGRSELRDEDDLDRAAAALRPLCRAAAGRGVSLLYEGTLPSERIGRLAAGVDSRAFGCYFDTANVVTRAMDTATELRALGGLVGRVHLKDARVTVGDCPPGLGRVDFAETARALDEIGYEGWVVLETPPGPPELVARDLAFVRTVVPRLEWSPPWPRFGVFARETADWDEVIAVCRRFGLGAVQLGGDLLEQCFDHPERAAALDHAGIAIAGIAGYRNLVDPDERARRENVEYLGRCLELAPRLGTSVVATESGTRSTDGQWKWHPDNRLPATVQLFHDAVAGLVEVAERHGSILALEGSVRHVLATHASLDGVLDRVPSRHLQVVCDPYNYLARALVPAAERVARDFLDRFEHRFVLAHLKDVSAEGAEAVTPEFGTGVFPQRVYVEFLAERRPDLALVLEHLPLANVADATERVLAVAR
jgi:sugar phosphate isomerase/epimerase